MKEKTDLQQMHEEQAQRKIETIREKIDTTLGNIEASKEIIDETPYDAQRDALSEKNAQRRHAVASLQKKIRDIEQEIEDSAREVTT